MARHKQELIVILAALIVGIGIFLAVANGMTHGMFDTISVPPTPTPSIWATPVV